MPTVKGDGMRGLAVFISDIRNCKLLILLSIFHLHGYGYMFIKIKYISITPDFIVNEKQMKVSKE